MNVYDYVCLLKTDLQTKNNEIYNYAYGQAGLSVHMVSFQGQVS